MDKAANQVNYPDLHRAIAFAVEAHMGQDRKYTHIPYISHPINVMEIVRTVSDDETMLIAAVLHDVVEDTEVSIEQIITEFGDRVGSLVADLTDVSKPEDGNREKRKSLDREHSANASASAQTIKLADIIHNAESILASDAHFAKVFMREAEVLIAVLTAGNKQLQNRARQTVQTYQESQLQQALRPD